MLIKTFVLNGHYCVLQIFWYLFDGDGKSVGIGGSKLTHLISVAVVQESGITKRHDIHFIYIWCIGKDTLDGAYAKSGNRHAQRNQTNEKDSDKGNVCSLAHHGGTGDEGVSLF